MMLMLQLIFKDIRRNRKDIYFTSGSAITGGKENGERSDFQFTEDIPLSPRLEMSLRVNINKAVLQAAQKI